MSGKPESARAGSDPNLTVYNSAEIASYYASLSYLSPCERELFETYVKPGMAVLDLGVGGGRTTAFLSSVASRYVGVDYAEEMIRACRRRFPGVEFVKADGSDLRMFPGETFDCVVFSFNGIDGVVPDENRGKCLRECHRVLKARGALIFSTHNPRAIFVRPAWDRQRIQAFAIKLVGRDSKVLGVATGAIACAKVVTEVARAIGASAARVATRLLTRAFWRGEGWVKDASHGGLRSHQAVPSFVIAETEQCGFHLLRVQGDDYPRRSGQFFTDWYYYAFSKAEAS